MLATASLELSGPGFASLPVIAPRTLVLAPLGVTPTYAFAVPLGAGPGTCNLTFSGAVELGGVAETSALSVVVQSSARNDLVPMVSRRPIGARLAGPW